MEYGPENQGRAQ
jgi:hypothetical protein